jgi:hypothetical protein
VVGEVESGEVALHGDLELSGAYQSIVATRWHGGLSGKLDNKRKRAGARRHPNKLDACDSVACSSTHTL